MFMNVASTIQINGAGEAEHWRHLRSYPEWAVPG